MASRLGVYFWFFGLECVLLGIGKAGMSEPFARGLLHPSIDPATVINTFVLDSLKWIGFLQAFLGLLVCLLASDSENPTIDDRLRAYLMPRTLLPLNIVGSMCHHWACFTPNAPDTDVVTHGVFAFNFVWGYWALRTSKHRPYATAYTPGPPKKEF